MDQQPVTAAPLGAAAVESWDFYNDGTRKPLLTVQMPYEVARRAAAFHEAGHAVVTAAYGAHIKVTGVIDLPAAGGRWELTGRTEFDGPPIFFWRYAAQCAAGERAQVRYLKAAGLWSPGLQAACAHHDDYESTAVWFREAGLVLTRDEDLPDGAYGMSWASAARIADLMLSMLWPYVEAVAAGIDARGLLTGDQAAALVGAVNPPPYGNPA
ncbi:hypothetical protein AB0D86_43455 [Streptomyces sp. NPDC048324]|uniref:hypothetical protein n=1 Tax=Streptomyces sp. NPDC048324 TaxID=3157205 RepID=UPI0034185D68